MPLFQPGRDPQTRYAMVRALASEGYELNEAQDGAGALGLLDTFQPAVILSDINMPGMDGRSGASLNRSVLLHDCLHPGACSGLLFRSHSHPNRF